MRHLHTASAVALTLAVSVVGCADPVAGPDQSTEPLTAPVEASRGAPDGPYRFAAAVFDISAAPDGSILVAQNTTVREIRRGGGVGEIVTIPTTAGSAINGLAAVGRRSFFATSAGQDLAVGAGLWRVSNGGARLVADIEAFETARDPDAAVWKNVGCEFIPDVFQAGPQSNPYHLAALSGSEALVADAAGNTLLWAKTNGEIDAVAVFTPPLDASGDYRVLFPLNDDTDCYVQPVPTSVAVGPEGDYYVGELTGATPDPADAIGLSRVWRIEAGARNVVCPSTDCTLVIDGLTSVIDVAFGPDGKLYVVEYDENGWLAAISGNATGGTINRCDVNTGACSVVAGGLVLPGAITFDKWGDLWVVENNIISPSVHRVDLP